jgi:hypothetical protein
MDCRVSDDLVDAISKDEIGQCIPLSFSNTNPAARLFRTVRREGVVNIV